MFPKLEKKFVFLYTLSTGIILTLILAVSFLFYISSQSSRQKSLFQDQLFTLMSQLETNSLFSDSYLSQIEHKNQLLIYIEENHSPFSSLVPILPVQNGISCSNVRKIWPNWRESFRIQTLFLPICCKVPYSRLQETTGIPIWEIF